VQEKVHQRESARARDQILAVVSLRLNAFRVSAIEDALGLVDKPLVTANKKSAGAAGWIGDRELRFAAGVRLHHAHDGLNQNAWREVLAGAFLSFARCFLEQA